jgi:AsmA protein
MTRVRKWLIAVAAVGVLLAAGAYVVAQQALGGDLVRSQIEQQIASRLGQPVHITSASAVILPSVAIDLRDLTIGQPAAVQIGRVRLATGLRGLISRRVENAAILVENGRVGWPLPFSLGATNGSSGGSSSVTVASVRQIQLRNVTVSTALPPITVDVDASLSGDRLDVTHVSARSDGNALEASGAMTSLTRLDGRFHLRGDLTFAGYRARNFSATLTLTSGGLSLTPMTFTMFDGKFDNGGLSIDLRQSVPRVQLKGSVARLDVADIVKNTGSTGGITGRLVGALSVSGTGTDGASLLRGSRGTFRATIVDGTLPYIDIVRPVILAFGKPSGRTPSGSGSSFSSLTGTFTLADATLATQNLTLETRDFTGRGTASLNVESGAIDSRLELVLSQELTAQAGTDLRRYAEQHGRVVMPATVGGTITHPSVFVDVAAAGRRAVENELKRKTGSLLKGIIKK